MAQRSSSTYGTKPNGIKAYDTKVKYLKWQVTQRLKLFHWLLGKVSQTAVRLTA